MDLYYIHNLKAIHNKDYSVVKTSKVARKRRLIFLDNVKECVEDGRSEPAMMGIVVPAMTESEPV